LAFVCIGGWFICLYVSVCFAEFYLCGERVESGYQLT